MDESHENRLRIGINGWHNISGVVRVMLLVQSELSCLLSIGHSWPWRRDHFHNRSCSTPPPHPPHTFPHIRPHDHAQSGSTQWAMVPCWIKKKEMTSCSLFVYLGCLSLMNHIPLLAAFLSLSDLHPGEE